MKENIIPTIRLTVIMLLLFAVVYPLVVWAIAQLAPGNGKGEVVEYNGRTYYANIGQEFKADMYFWSRPSAVGYDASHSGASNSAPSNKTYLATVQARIDTFLTHNHGVSKAEIPVDLVTASGSGLDPDISVQAARVQVKRIAKSRNLSESTLLDLIGKQTDKPLLGMFGTEKVNVLRLNIALDKLK